MQSGHSDEGENLCLLHKGSPDISAIGCVAEAVFTVVLFMVLSCVDIWIMKVFCMRFQVSWNVTLICWVSGSQRFEGILSLCIQASSSLRKTTSAECLVMPVVVSVGGWLEGVAISVTISLTTPFKGHTIYIQDIPTSQVGSHPHQPSTKQYHYICILSCFFRFGYSSRTA